MNIAERGQTSLEILKNIRKIEPITTRNIAILRGNNFFLKLFDARYIAATQQIIEKMMMPE